MTSLIKKTAVIITLATLITQNINALTTVDVAAHSTSTSCYQIYFGNVYDATNYLNTHPGGFNAIANFCGADASQAFNQGSGAHNANALPNKLVSLGPLTVATTQMPTTQTPTTQTPSTAKATTVTATTKAATTVTATTAKAATTVTATTAKAATTIPATTAKAATTVTATTAKAGSTSSTVTTEAGCNAITTCAACLAQVQCGWCTSANTVNGGIGGCALAYAAGVGADQASKFASQSCYQGVNNDWIAAGTSSAIHTCPAPAPTSPITLTTQPAATSNTIPSSAVNPSSNSPAATSQVAPSSSSSSGITMTNVAAHNTQNDCWIVYFGMVYDNTAYISKHPGGSTAIINNCGTDASNAYTNGFVAHVPAKMSQSLVVVGALAVAPTGTTGPASSTSTSTGSIIVNPQNNNANTNNGDWIQQNSMTFYIIIAVAGAIVLLLAIGALAYYRNKSRASSKQSNTDNMIRANAV